VLAGVLVLALGTSYYLICRSHPPAILVHFATLHQCRTGWLGVDWLAGFPTFAHTAAFSLACAGLTCAGWQPQWALVWTGTNIGAELWSAIAIEPLGTFDPIDISSACLGGLASLIPNKG